MRTQLFESDSLRGIPQNLVELHAWSASPSQGLYVACHRHPAIDGRQRGCDRGDLHVNLVCIQQQICDTSTPSAFERVVKPEAIISAPNIANDLFFGF